MSRFFIIEITSWVEGEDRGRRVSLPAEISVVEMSVAKGVGRSFLQFVHPGKLKVWFEKCEIFGCSHFIAVDRN